MSKHKTCKLPYYSMSNSYRKSDQDFNNLIEPFVGHVCKLKIKERELDIRLFPGDELLFVESLGFGEFNSMRIIDRENRAWIINSWRLLNITRASETEEILFKLEIDE